ncbi:HAD-IA family hydrolase [Pseudaquabacterium pictum]|uniref:Phosphoglycolate phosphatase n=1 Tax=Pseudaquabacterium pictum TaxID=2315236 RepID=A0A480AXF9_9BURK|nr:HAD-IA family hydrolase [Rubrivivax pictus]GCL64797.1 phosphoglycolate phosphatase [Rubrivivax pictus]
MPAPDIHAVIWDFGGVISSSPFEAFAAYEQAHGLPADFLRTVNATNHLDNAWARFERSDIDLATFDAEFAAESAALGHAVRGKAVIALLGGTIRPQMVQALRVLRGRLKIGLITNNVASPGAENADPTGRDAVLPLFHHVIESAKLGLRKPDPQIYRLMCEALAVAPEHCVFLDDLGVNLKPARDMGMHTIKVGDPDVALAQLQALVGFPLQG